MLPALLGLPGKVKTLLDRLTSTRAGYLDNLDVAVTTRLGSIKSIQRGTINVTHASSVRSSATATITSVATSKSVIVLLGCEHGVSSAPTETITGRVELTNGTTVTAFTSMSATGISNNINVAYQVIEFN